MQTNPTPVTETTCIAIRSMRIHDILSLLTTDSRYSKPTDWPNYKDKWTAYVRSMHSAGYDLNRRGSSLLMHALEEQNFDKVTLLLSLGALTHCHDDVHYRNGSSAYAPERTYTPEIALLLKEHIMSLGDKDLTVIRTAFYNNTRRLSVFSALDDTHATELYIKINALPTGHIANTNVQIQCGRAGLFYPKKKDRIIKAIADADLATKLADVTNDDIATKLADTEEKLKKALAIISRLTSLDSPAV